MIIPFFIPHAGCPHQCVFCNQRNITGQNNPEGISSIPRKVREYLKAMTFNEPVQIAFYGGSFTSLPKETQKNYLGAAWPFVRSGEIESIRLSTRPDSVIQDNLTMLRGYLVKTVELGAQSLDDHVLSRSGRGHTAADTVNAVRLLKKYNMTVGLQLMPGLPGDSADRFLDTVDKTIALRPDFVRLYPTLVIEGTPLAELYVSGRYAPLTLDNAVAICRSALEKFERAGIDVIRVGLQSTEGLERPGTIIAGPNHPAFRQIVESAILLDRMRTIVAGSGTTCSDVTLLVNPHDISFAIGQKRSNIKALSTEFGIRDIRILPDSRTPKRTVRRIDG